MKTMAYVCGNSIWWACRYNWRRIQLYKIPPRKNIVRNNSGFAYMYDAVKQNIIPITHNTKEL